eukprot:scaffold69500_cov18-Prasinocladus_malaysianus.AAC.1
MAFKTSTICCESNRLQRPVPALVSGGQAQGGAQRANERTRMSWFAGPKTKWRECQMARITRAARTGALVYHFTRLRSITATNSCIYDAVTLRVQVPYLGVL